MKIDRPSSTSLLIARSLLFLSSDDTLQHLVPKRRLEATIALLEACGVGTGHMLWFSKRALFRKAAWALERLLLPGILAHYAARKIRIEEVARRELLSGCEQVVILGAGLDVLGMLLHEDFPNARVIEVDQPATARWKWDRIHIDLQLPQRIAIDLECDSLELWLQQHSAFQPQRRTLFLAEGLLMYLSDEAVDRLFRGVSATAGKGSRFLFTFMERYPDGRVRFGKQSRIIDSWLELRGEPFRWSCQRSEIEEFLARYDMVVDEVWAHAEFREAYGVADLAEGDLLCVAGI